MNWREFKIKELLSAIGTWYRWIRLASAVVTLQTFKQKHLTPLFRCVAFHFVDEKNCLAIWHLAPTVQRLVFGTCFHRSLFHNTTGDIWRHHDLLYTIYWQSVCPKLRACNLTVVGFPLGDQTFIWSWWFDWARCLSWSKAVAFFLCDAGWLLSVDWEVDWGFDCAGVLSGLCTEIGAIFSSGAGWLVGVDWVGARLGLTIMARLMTRKRMRENSRCLFGKKVGFKQLSLVGIPT